MSGHSVGLDKCLMSCVQHLSIPQNSFSALKAPVPLPLTAAPSPGSHPLTWILSWESGQTGWGPRAASDEETRARG